MDDRAAESTLECREMTRCTLQASYRTAGTRPRQPRPGPRPLQSSGMGGGEGTSACGGSFGSSEDSWGGRGRWVGWGWGRQTNLKGSAKVILIHDYFSVKIHAGLKERSPNIVVGCQYQGAILFTFKCLSSQALLLRVVEAIPSKCPFLAAIISEVLPLRGGDS